MAAKDTPTSYSCNPPPCPPGVSIVDALPEGRGLVSTRNWSKGSKIFEDSPLCYVVGTYYYQRVCANCFRLHPGEVPLLCSGCKYNHYCNKTCQQQDWPVHKGECIGMMNNSLYRSNNVRMVMRMMMKKKQMMKKGNPWPVEFLSKHEKKQSSRAKNLEIAVDLLGIMKMCENNNHVKYDGVHELFDLLSLLLCNAFCILSVDMNHLGEGLYILPSLLNHSCQPNCAAVFDGLKMSIRTVQDVEPGQQLYQSYVVLLDPRKKRQQTLKDTYHFTCQCPRCTSVSSLDSLLTSVLCAKCGKVCLTEEVSESSIFDISLCCCGGSPHSVIITAEKLVREFNQLMSESSRDEAMLVRYSSFQTRASKVLSPYHYVSIRAQEKIMELALENFQWRLAFNVGQTLTPLYKLFLEPHLWYTLHLMKLCIVSNSLGERKRHVDELRHQVLTNLNLTHGSQHTLTQSFKQRMQSPH